MNNQDLLNDLPVVTETAKKYLNLRHSIPDRQTYHRGDSCPSVVNSVSQ